LDTATEDFLSVLLEGEGLRYMQGNRQILAIDHMAVEEQEILVLLGTTGAGKSTLLRMMNFLLFPQAGSFRWHGLPVRRPIPLDLRRKIAMAFQEPLLFEGTVYQNTAYGLSLRGINGQRAREKTMEMLQILKIDHLARRSARHLSGGEAQRTALARALVIRPELLLLDEPLASLDLPTKEQLAKDLKQLLVDQRLTCVYVTHDQEEAFQMADRIAVLEEGRLQQLGTPEEVFFRPQSAFVARFVRTENILKGKVVRNREGLATVQIRDRTVEAVSNIAPGKRVLVCLRPEDVLLRQEKATEESRDSARNRLPAEIQSLQRFGVTTKVFLDCGFSLVALITHRSAEDMGLQPASHLVASFKATALHLIEEGDSDT
jgi:tungstate transport system ATP-binding protein